MNTRDGLATVVMLLLTVAPAVALAAPVSREAGPPANPRTASEAAPGTPTPAAPDSEAVAQKDRDRDRATQLFREGNQALDSGDYRGALAKFEAAYGLFPSPKLLFNMAQAYNELGRLVEAVEHYERFVRDFPKAESPDLFALAHKRIFGLQGQIVSLRVETNVVGAKMTVDGRSYGDTPIAGAIRLLPGPHALVLQKEGYEPQLVQKKLGPGSTVLRIELLTRSEAMAKRAEVRRLEEKRRLAEENLHREQEESRRSRALRLRTLRISGWTVLGTGLAILVAGTGFGINSVVKTNDVESRPEGTPWSEVAADYRAAEQSRLGFQVGMGLGTAVVAAGAVILYVHSRMARQEQASPPAGVAVPPGAVGARSLRILPAAGPGGLGASLSLDF